jgi:release factor glutamine methyltransferase
MTGTPATRGAPGLFDLPRTRWRRLRAATARLRFLLRDRHRHDRLTVEHLAGRPLIVLPGVFNPVLLRTGVLLDELLDDRLVPTGGRVLDLGTGTGVGALAAIRVGAASVVAVDVDERAVRCARINALLAGCEDRIDVRHGDLFEPVVGERFDVVLFNPPFLGGRPDPGGHPLQRAFRAGDVLERFADGLAAHLAPGGHAVLVLSSVGVGAALIDRLADHGFASVTVATRDLGYERIGLVRVARAADTSP